MTVMNTTQLKKRNLIIFVLLIFSTSWIGLLYDFLSRQSLSDHMGAFMWLITPFITTIGLRWLGKDGWKNSGIGLGSNNIEWYSVALLIPTLFTGVLLALIWSCLGIYQFQSFRKLLTSVIYMLPALFIKNVLLEEIAWRGYWIPKLNDVTGSRVKTHVITGVAWGLWHIPYWLFFISEESYNVMTSLVLWQYILIGFLTVVAWSFFFTELRLRSGSIWPVVIAHTLMNAFYIGMMTERLFPLIQRVELLFSPCGPSLISVLFFFIIGVCLMKLSIRTEGA